MRERRGPRVTERPATYCDCEAFKKNPDGSWTSTKQTRAYNPAGFELMLSPGMIFRKGKGLESMGFDLAEYLEENCK